MDCRVTTEFDGVRQRGRNELAAAGKASALTLVYPLFPAPASPGLLPPRALCRFTDEEGEDYLAQILSNQIKFNRSGDACTVRQALTIERQFRDATP